MKCVVQWVDDSGNPTPDDNEAVGYAVLARSFSRGPLAGRTNVDTFPCCETHRKRGFEEGIFGNREVQSYPMFDAVATWGFEPLS